MKYTLMHHMKRSLAPISVKGQVGVILFLMDGKLV